MSKCLNICDIQNLYMNLQYLLYEMFKIFSAKRLACILILCVSILAFFFYLPYQHSFHNIKNHQWVKVPNCEHGKIVLFWTKYFEVEDFYIGFGNNPFKQCPAIVSCCTTNNRSLLHAAAAVVFHIRDLDLDDIPHWRSPHQRWVFFLLESPLHTPAKILNKLNNVFNWTMTYRTDSDIHARYPVIEMEDAIEYDMWNTTFENNLWQRKVHGKKKMVAWFVSNCMTTSGRENYVDELKKYVEVDIYGECGQLECFDHIECYKMMEQNYKFYLAFENSICRDYVTEKFYNALFFNTVPIVFGGANYSAIAPKDSYIDVRDFPSVRQLAEYLNFLDKNKTAYMSYFAWRKIPPGLASLPRIIHPWCKLCSMLNNASLPTSSYANIDSWWFEQGHCEKDHRTFKI